MDKEEDRRIQSVFEQLRKEEGKSAPEFQQVLYGKESPSHALGWRLFWRPAAALLCLLLVAGPVLYFSLHDTGFRE